MDLSSSATLAAVSRDSVFISVTPPFGISPIRAGATVVAVSTESNAATRWSRELGYLQVGRVLVDSLERAYVVAHEPIQSAPESGIFRLSRDGEFDTSWRLNATVETRLREVFWNNIALIGDRILILHTAFTGAPLRPMTSLMALDTMGSINIVRALDDAMVKSVYELRLIEGQSRAFVATSNNIFSFDAPRLNPFGSFRPPPFGVGNPYVKVTLASDGGFVVTGIFSAWYEGVEYRNALRILPSGLPDASRRISPDVAALFDRISNDNGNELLLYQRLKAPRKNSQFYVWTGEGTESRLLAAPIADGDMILAAVLGADGWIYYVHYQNSKDISVRRVNRESGAADLAWTLLIKRQGLESSDEFISETKFDSQGSLWLEFAAEASFAGCPCSEWFRYKKDAPSLPATSLPVRGCQTPPIHLSRTHAYFSNARYPLASPELLADSTWQPSVTPSAVGDQYVYFFDVTSGNTPRQTTVTRSSTASNGTLDANWVRTLVGEPAGEHVMTFENGGIALLGRSAANTTRADRLYVFSDATPENNTPVEQTVVEYYSRDANRYFITSRASEKALLDALTQSFERTGMQFAASAPTFADTLQQPVCRFYAPLERGGSNTHFYGVGDDCMIVNALLPLAYEGFDFAATMPTNEACPAAYPLPISRVFNPAANSANHRYVVDAATKSRMISLGWRDEGVVFCTASVSPPMK